MDCIHFMTLTNCFNYFIIIIIVYTSLETLLYAVFITAILNGNYSISFLFIFGLKMSLYWH